MKNVLLALGDLFDLLPDAVIVIDGKGKIVHTNYSVTPVLGYRSEELVGESLSILIPERYRSLHQRQIEDYHHHGQPTSMGSRPILKASHRSGMEVPISISITNLELDAKRFSVAIVRDARPLSEHLDAVTALAERDTLTGLYNRLSLSKRIHEALKRRQPFALFFIDLSKFKPFNDTYGHKVGDEVLKLIADRLQGQVRRDDAAARVGGDEFVLLLNDLNDKKLLTTRAHKIIHHIQSPFCVSGIEGSIEANIGGAIYPEDGNSEEMLLSVADRNMYQAKSQNSQYFYHADAE